MSLRPAARAIKPAAPIAALSAAPAAAHVSEQGFVLLLPTEIYTAAGVTAVAATVLLIALLPPRAAVGLFRPLPLLRLRAVGLRQAVSLASAALLVFLLWSGLNGPRDPLVNPLPLAIWTVWWIGLVALQGLLGDIWRWINPVTGPLALIGALTGGRPPWRWPKALGRLPALALFLGLSGFLLADPAPADPARVAWLVGTWWIALLAGACLFGPRVLVQVDPVTVLMRIYGRTGLFGPRGRRGAAGLWGWQWAVRGAPSLGLAVFMLLLLGSGSFDGLNETFWWLGLLGINPLEFPGRSEIVWQTVGGLLVANAALIAVYAASLWAGLRLARSDLALGPAFRLFAPSILPIALGYHIAHYFTAFLVDGQYALAALSDPLARGWDLLGLGTFYVTTGFFNTEATVRAIWLTQAGAVVVGHVVAILLAHAIAVAHLGTSRRAALAQAPLAVFMVGYTFFGLWLLAAPRGA